MNTKASIEKASAIVFSASMNMRDYLRNILSKGGFSAVCFESESICFDNVGTIHPEIVIAETDSVEVVWRFIFALDAIDDRIPLMVISDSLQVNSFLNKWVVPIHTVPMNHLGKRLMEKAAQIIERKRRGGKEFYNKGLPLFVGHTDAIKKIQNMLPSIANTCDPVLIDGEPGTGKELLARLIFSRSKGENEYIKIDCAEFGPDRTADSNLLRILEVRSESKQATIFIDHLDQLSLASQAEMLLLIDTLKMAGNRSNGEHNDAVRFIAASDQKIEGLMRKGDFRKDLFYRLNVIPITIPALRERKADIPMLMDYFIINGRTKNLKCISIPSQKERDICTMHDWPGNVDELKNKMNRFAQTGNKAHLLANADMIKVPQNKKYLLSSFAVGELPKSDEIKGYLLVSNHMSLKCICNRFVNRTERRLIKKALESTSWNRKKAAELLNISYKSMLNKMKAYDII